MKRVLIIHTDGNTFNNPSLISLLDLLLSKSVLVDIKYPGGRAPMPEVIGIKLKPWGRLRNRLKHIINDKLCSWFLSRLFLRLECLLVGMEFYDLVIAVDRLGLIEAAHLKSLYGFPFVLFSFEVMFESETSQRYKALERRASSAVSHWFVQDEVRAACLSQENGLPREAATLIPLASTGVGYISQERMRDHIGVPKNKKVAILIGSLSPWTQAKEIIGSVLVWPEDWVLIVHDRYGATLKLAKQYSEGRDIICQNRVYFSDRATAMVDDLGFVLAGASVGLALYKPVAGSPYTGRNLVNIGLASGKIASYLRYGVPIVTNRIGLYSDLVLAHQFGDVVEDASDIGRSLASQSWSDKGLKARQFFLEHLDFSLYRDMVWHILSRCSDAKPIVKG